MHKNILGYCLLTLFFLAACNKSNKPHQNSQKHFPKVTDELQKAKLEEAEAKSIDTLTVLSSKLSPDAAKAVIEVKANEIVRLIGKKAFASIGKQYAHPVHGIRFSPYSYIELEQDQVYAPSQVMQAWGDSTLVKWGTEEGKGEAIKLAFPAYYERFIYNKKYEESTKIKYNESEGTGNAIDNWKKAYPNAIMVEYYMEGTNPGFGGMDWGSLRLFFEAHNGKWWLVGIAHGEWTT